MKRLDSRNVSPRSDKRLALNRETMRRLDAQEMQQVAGGLTNAPSCLGCTTLKNSDA